MANQVKINKTVVQVGDTVQVHNKVKEGDKERVQVFEGVLIAIKGKGTGKSFTVRRIATGAIGVERIWPVICPSIVKVEVKKKGKVRRAKLYYLRHRVGKKATRIKTKKIEKVEEVEKVVRGKSDGKKRNTEVLKKTESTESKKDEEEKTRKSRRKSSPKVSKK